MRERLWVNEAEGLIIATSSKAVYLNWICEVVDLTEIDLQF